MPGMPRPLNKACKVVFDLLGVPVTLQDDKKVKQYMKSNKSVKTDFSKENIKIDHIP